MKLWYSSFWSKYSYVVINVIVKFIRLIQSSRVMYYNLHTKDFHFIILMTNH